METIAITATLDKGKATEKTADGTCEQYTATEIAVFEKNGMKTGHGKALNLQVKIIALNKLRATLEEKSEIAIITKMMKGLLPEKIAEIKALAGLS